MPYIARKKARLRRGKPIRYDHHDYWHQSFAHAPKEPINVEVKWDPENSEIVYVYYPDKWIMCRLTSRRNRPLNKDKVHGAEVSRQEAKINSAARKRSYVDMSTIVDEVEEAIIDMTSAPEEIQSEKTQASEGGVTDSSVVSLFDLDIPEAFEK